jgi:thiol-disulfide isomerase/thioredoxin
MPLYRVRPTRVSPGMSLPGLAAALWICRLWPPRLAAAVVALALCSPVSAGGLFELDTKPQAPDFELLDIGGETYRLSEHRGRVVLVNFWASWCAPCRAEMPSLERLKQRIDGEDFEILAINLGETKEDISRFYFSVSPPLTFKLLMDRDQQASQYWPMRGLPMTFLVDKEGRVTHVSQGARRWDTSEVSEVIESLQGDAGRTTGLIDGAEAGGDS